MATMSLSEFREKMKSGEVSASSKFAMRNEDIQTKYRMAYYNMLKKEKAKSAKLLIPKELAFDFDPIAGAPTDEYNRGHKFRPMMSATSLALLVKQMANEVPATKARLMERAGVTEWDTSDATTLTDDDKAIFNNYSYPQIFTLPIINTTLDALKGNSPYGRSYLLSVNRDPDTGKIVGDVPFPLKANAFYSAIAQEEFAAYEQKVKDGDEVATSDQVSKQRGVIFDARVKVSSDFPSNYVRCFEFAIDEDFNIDEAKEKIASMTPERMAEHLVLSRYTAKIRDAIKKYQSGAWKKKDVCFDFFVLDMSCPTDKDDPKEIGSGTSFEKMDTLITETDTYAKLHENVVAVLDSEGDCEQKVWASTRITKFDEDVEVKMRAAMEAEFDLKTPWLTEKVIQRHADFICDVWGEEGDSLVLQAEGGFSGKAEGTYKEEEATKNAKEVQAESFDVEAMMEMDLENMDLGLEEVPQ